MMTHSLVSVLRIRIGVHLTANGGEEQEYLCSFMESLWTNAGNEY